MRYTLKVIAVVINLLSTNANDGPKFSDFLNEAYVVFSTNNDIIQLTYPTNAINQRHMTDKYTLFFVEAVLEDNGEVKEYKGLYHYKAGNAKLLLEDGTSIAVNKDDSTLAYFGAKSGIYVYNDTDKTTKRYGTIDENIIDIVKLNGAEELYILTKDNALFKIKNKGTKKCFVKGVYAKQIAIDSLNNVYFYSHDEEPFILKGNETMTLGEIPEQTAGVMLYKTVSYPKDGALMAVNDNGYILGPDHVERQEGIFDVKLTSLILHTRRLKFAAYEKKIYEYIVHIK